MAIERGLAINKARLLKGEPGDRLGSEMSPMIALRDGRPVLAVATVGSSLVQENVRLIDGLLAGEQDLPTLMAAPPLLLNTGPFVPGQALIELGEPIPAEAYDAKMREGLAADGVNVREEPAQTVRALRGTAVVGVIDQPSGRPRAVEVPGVFGFAEVR